MINYSYSQNFDLEILLSFIATYSLFILILAILMLISMWKIFKKAGKKGWEAVIPIYNLIVLLEITNLPKWYVLLLFIPFINIYILFKIYIELAHAFGKSTMYGVLMVFFNFICLPILAFSKNVIYIARSGGGLVDNIGKESSQNAQNNLDNTIESSSIDGGLINTNFNEASINNNQIETLDVTNNVNENTSSNNEKILLDQQSQLEENKCKYCPRCGKLLENIATFCPNCGYKM